MPRAGQEAPDYLLRIDARALHHPRPLDIGAARQLILLSSRSRTSAVSVIETADSVVVAVGNDEVAVRVTSIVRGLNQATTVCTAVHDPAWEPVAQCLGADQVVIASRLCGRLLGRALVQPDLPSRIAGFLRSRPEVVVAERPPRAGECGRTLTDCSPLVLAARRDGRLLWRDPVARESVLCSDRVMVLSLSWGPRRDGR
ncbi:NAD-binding protein [Nocardia rhizosphaerihabitans]|uniref:NAD-binding protein n=1 Tax=Nocardia rhizosphaerihabitans TaxID=1691570 RepID=UPI0035709C13